MQRRSFSPMVRGMQSLIKEWSYRLEALDDEAVREYDRLSVDSRLSDKDRAELWLVRADYYAFRGVKEYLELVHKHRSDLEQICELMD